MRRCLSALRPAMGMARGDVAISEAPLLAPARAGGVLARNVWRGRSHAAPSGRHGGAAGCGPARDPRSAARSARCGARVRHRAFGAGHGASGFREPPRHGERIRNRHRAGSRPLRLDARGLRRSRRGSASRPYRQACHAARHGQRRDSRFHQPPQDRSHRGRRVRQERLRACRRRRSTTTCSTCSSTR